MWIYFKICSAFPGHGVKLMANHICISQHSDRPQNGWLRACVTARDLDKSFSNVTAVSVVCTINAFRFISKHVC